jgi:rifampicin phosphotransferase
MTSDISKLKIATIDDPVSAEIYGNKAYGLSWLQKQGYAVPYSVFIPALKNSVSELPLEFSLAKLRKVLYFAQVDNRYDIAIRSSATCEDSKDNSFAGHFCSKIDVMTLDEILEGINQVIVSLKKVPLEDSCRMGVILQKRIDASFSGIAFSSNPISAKRNECVINVIPGFGDALTSGKVAGEKILVSKTEESYKISTYTTKILESYINKIADYANEIEHRLGQPVDIEWCIEKSTGKLYLLQCRLVTGILRLEDPLVQVCLENESRIPPIVIYKNKVAVRLLAEHNNVLMSKAYLVNINHMKEEIGNHDFQLIKSTSFCKGYSAVLIYPESISGKIIRFFTSHAEIAKTIDRITQISSLHSWISIVILQEIYEPEFTGIARRSDEKLIIEIARGHFIPKGVVPTTQYIVDVDGNILTCKEVTQDIYFKIEGERIQEVKLAAKSSLVSLPQNVLRKMAQSLLSLPLSESTSIEFGLIKNESSELETYLIDLVEDKNDKLPGLQIINEGVISQGFITGEVVILPQDLQELKSFDFHFYDDVIFDNSSENSYIYICSFPYISLLDIVRRSNPKKIGFIFEEASVLCHFSIILRENNIPAVQLDNFNNINNGDIVTIDAIKPGLKRAERVFINEFQ